MGRLDSKAKIKLADRDSPPSKQLTIRGKIQITLFLAVMKAGIITYAVPPLPCLRIVLGAALQYAVNLAALENVAQINLYSTRIQL